MKMWGSRASDRGDSQCKGQEEGNVAGTEEDPAQEAWLGGGEGQGGRALGSPRTDWLLLGVMAGLEQRKNMI